MPVVRLVLLLIALAAAGLFIAAHGVRAIAALVVLTLALTVPRTRSWRVVERALVRVTGSRRRAYVSVALVVIGVALVVNLYPYVH